MIFTKKSLPARGGSFLSFRSSRTSPQTGVAIPPKRAILPSFAVGTIKKKTETERKHLLDRPSGIRITEKISEVKPRSKKNRPDPPSSAAPVGWGLAPTDNGPRRTHPRRAYVMTPPTASVYRRSVSFGIHFEYFPVGGDAHIAPLPRNHRSWKPSHRQ